MHLSTLLEQANAEKLPPLQRRVFRYLEQRPEEVFEYRDLELAQAVGGKPSSVGFSLWALHKRGLIEKESVSGKVYFGSKAAVAMLRLKLGIAAGEYPFNRATRNLLQVREQVGNIDIQSLLDEVREGR